MLQTGIRGRSSIGRAVLRVVSCVLVLGIGVTALSGCGPAKAKMGRYTVSLQPSGAAAGQAYDVDLFGVEDEATFSGWGSQRVAEHFAGGAKEVARQALKPVTLHWEKGDSSPKRLEITDPMWTVWENQNAWFLVIVSSRDYQTGQGVTQKAEPIIIPLDRRRWKTKLITIAVEGSGLQLNTRKEPLPQ